MTAERDMTRVVRSWLRTDEHESAARVLDNVLAALDTTPQRRPPILPAWRISERMNRYVKIVVAAAAVLILAVFVYNQLPGRGSIGGPGSSPSPSPTRTLAPETFPQGALTIGRHGMDIAGKRLTFDVPIEGWTADAPYFLGYGSIGPEGFAAIWWTSDAPVGMFSDPCAQTEAPEVGHNRAELAAAVVGIPGLEEVVAPTDVTVGGKPATTVAVRMPDPLPCPKDQFYLWHATSADEGRFATDAGFIIYTWIIDVDGTLVWVDWETSAEPGSQPVAQIQALMDSIQFE
ncbi:MAG TPA: hypothetical protein VFC71_04560 [Candidatus Polarisedimenticolia bacterium]|nr:hypothetical protein [Candidatus Polarisedimenticolia bacterium]